MSAASFAIAIGLNFIAGLEQEHAWNVYTWIADNTDIDYWAINRFEENGYTTLLYFSSTVEEAIEMFAHSVLLYLCFRHIYSAYPIISIDFGGRQNENAPRS